ncbi:hypothetical protein ACNVED_05910 [Legionella sp. D16C41]|uniref:hypothetical protein n=1 Tax=Legionella sp. D16C41 TaxID=3402688 RepID=UPI003AF52011
MQKLIISFLFTSILFSPLQASSNLGINLQEDKNAEKDCIQKIVKKCIAKCEQVDNSNCVQLCRENAKNECRQAGE